MIRAILIALALACPVMTQAAQLEADARVVWTDEAPRFGGFSGIEVLDDGAAFVVIGDRGSWARGRMIRDEDGTLTGVETTGLGPLRSISGDRLRGADNDAEGLAIDSQGRFWVSFEGFHRVRRYDAIDEPASDVPGHPDFPRLQENSGLEALAIDANDVLYAIPERSGRLTRPFPVYRFSDGEWDKSLEIPRSDVFLVVGADFGPDGRLYVLERDFRWTNGFSNRIRRFALSPDGFDEGETILDAKFAPTDNFEGISVWRDANGRTRVTLLADDNFFALQSTAIAEYLLVED